MFVPKWMAKIPKRDRVPNHMFPLEITPNVKGISHDKIEVGVEYPLQAENKTPIFFK